MNINSPDVLVEGLEGSRKTGEKRNEEAQISVFNLIHPYYSVDPETHMPSSLGFDCRSRLCFRPNSNLFGLLRTDPLLPPTPIPLAALANSQE